MPTPPMSKTKAAAFVALVEKLLGEGFAPPGTTPPKGRRGALAEARARLGYNAGDSGVLTRCERAIGREVNWSLWRPAGAAPPVKAKAAPIVDEEAVKAQLLTRAIPLDDLADKLGFESGSGALRLWIEQQRAGGININVRSGMVRIDREIPTARTQGREPMVITSDRNNRFVFGLSGDQHLCSKYARLDVLNDLYDRFQREGVKHVFNTGNWIDGEARFNTHDLLVHGFDAQLRYLAEHFPVRKGMQTHAVWGDDHEGWYGQRFGVDVGRRAEQVMRDAGRQDWHDLGFMEAHVILRNANTGKESVMAVVHPGGGSAYATSYTMQKIVEGYDGGEKPAILAAGHYHKMETLNVRNVWAIQTGCTQDQTPFMRKKKLEAHVGGVLVNCEQDPRTGAIIELNGLQRYFVRGYYPDRWSHSGPVVQPRRTVGGL